MPSANWIWDVIAWMSLPLLAILAGVMVWKRLVRVFPFFFTYVVVTAAIGVIRFVAYKGYSAQVYFVVYWSSDFVILLTTFLAIYEVFLRRIFPGFAKVQFYRYLFPIFAFLISLVAFLLAMHAHDRRTAFLTISRVFDFLRSAVIGFFVLLILFMGRAFTGYEFSIASGFGIQAALALAHAAIRFQGGRSTIMERLELIAYDVACLIWLWSFASGEKNTPKKSSQEVDTAALHEAKKWEESLKGFIARGKR
ncbi:MAG TPA: hypothetical protein VHA06_12180 [Candidatus Angelobacter sp.]|jgi:hypothetical protein|nr:hypothetical protein [Candidatus Angelobacter sp.]